MFGVGESPVPVGSFCSMGPYPNSTDTMTPHSLLTCDSNQELTSGISVVKSPMLDLIAVLQLVHCFSKGLLFLLQLQHLHQEAEQALHCPSVTFQAAEGKVRKQ